jgi:hypothetical protein
MVDRHDVTGNFPLARLTCLHLGRAEAVAQHDDGARIALEPPFELWKCRYSRPSKSLCGIRSPRRPFWLLVLSRTLPSQGSRWLR